jgi:hypothetical protein
VAFVAALFRDMLNTEYPKRANAHAMQRFETSIQKMQCILRKLELFEGQFANAKQRMPRELTDNVRPVLLV